MVRQHRHPNRIEPVHSEESDGYDDGSGYHRAVYHTCRNCHYYQTIRRNRNRKQGYGTDDNGRLRRLCNRCQILRNDYCC